MNAAYPSFLCAFPVITRWLSLNGGVSMNDLSLTSAVKQAWKRRCSGTIVGCHNCVKEPTIVSDSFLNYWRNLEAMIPVEVEFVEAGLASGLPRAADHDRHGHGQASSFSCRDYPQEAPSPTSEPSRHPTARRAPTTTRRPDLSRPQTSLYYADTDT